jgi:hypothetical protein
MRMRVGYVPIKSEEISGWDQLSIKSGEWTGFVGVNEMLAFKIPLDLYSRLMMEAHHDAPLREEEKLNANVDSIRASAKSKGADIIEGEGNREMRERAVPRPAFSG